MNKRILISVINNVTYDQRVIKTAQTLQNAGYEVIVFGSQLGGNPPIVKDYTIERFPLYFQKGPLLYAEFNMRLLGQLIKHARKGDILWANDLDSLLPNFWVSRWRKIPLIFDSHELFSELPSVQGRFAQKVWRFLESKLISKPNQVITVSDSIANWMKNKYKIPMPKVIKNMPYLQKAESQADAENYILYQGALNGGRGLVELINAMNAIPEDVHLKIAGDGPFRPKIEEAISKNNLETRVTLLGKIHPNQLLPLTQNALMGVSLEQDLGLSYRYSLPNKLFDYIQARTPILGTYLPEIKSIIKQYQIGEVIKSHAPEDIARAINMILNKGRNSYYNQLENAATALNWEMQEESILQILNSIDGSDEIS